MSSNAYYEVDLERWLPGGLSFESMRPVLVTPQLALPGPDPIHEIYLFEPSEIVIPEIEGLSLVLPGSVGGAPLQVFLSDTGDARISAPILLRIRSHLLQPMKPGSDEIDETAEFMDIELGAVTLVFPADGGITLEGATGISVPRCMIGNTGLIIEATDLRFVTADDDDPFVLAPGAPGIALEGVTLELPGALPGIALTMENVFIGAGGFWGLVAFEDRNLSWDGNNFQGAVTGDLLGFPGGLHRVGIELRQSAFVGARIEGDVFLPFLDMPVGVTLGLDGNGGFTASAGPAHSPDGAQASDQFLFEAGIGDFLSVGIDSLTFTTEPIATVTLGGEFEIDIPLLEAPAITVEGLGIDANGKVSVEGGWIDLKKAVAASVGGFPLELTRLGLGSEEGSSRRWLGLNGAIRMAAGLPAGASVEGLRLSWNPDAADISSSLRVSLDGIGLEIAVPGAFKFKGSVAFFEDADATGFRGHGQLDLVSLGMEIDAGIVVGRTISGDTFFFFHLDLELPTGIPLFTTGAALYGLSGLVADDMGPDRSAQEDWYWDWYQRPSKGATDPGKWAVEPGAFAVGLGATVGTAFDDGFTFNTSCLLVLVLPGPRILLSGSGNFLSSRKSDGEGAFDALLVLDTPGRLFQANLSAQYEIPLLISARGGIDVGFSWASPPPPDLWHAWLGQYEPRERRIGATWLKVLKAEAWLMVDRSGLDLGGWAGIDETFGFPPFVTVIIDIGIDGRGRVAWDPLHFMGELNLGGTVGVRAFGIGATLTALATVAAQAPKPFWLLIELFAELEVDLFLISFKFSHTVVLEWGDENQPIPVPSPPIQRIAFEHELARVNLPHSSNAPVPPDVRPVVVFRRPVRDPAGIAEPSVPVAEDVVGKFRFYHEVGHVVLRSENDDILSAAGFVAVDGATVTVGGLQHNGVVGGTMELAGIGQFSIDAVTATGLTLAQDSGRTEERVAYRLRAPVTSEAITIEAVGEEHFATRSIHLRDPVAASAGIVGGLLKTSDGDTWRILHAEGSELVIRERTDRRDPAVGAAQILEREAPMIGGSWLAGTDGDLGGTRLMLWASNPFAWFRSNDGRTRDLVEDSNEACGPQPTETLKCLELGPELAVGAKEATLLLNVSGEAKFLRRDMRNIVHLGPRPGTSGTLVLRFNPPVERVEIRASKPEAAQTNHAPSGMAIARNKGTQTGTAVLGDGFANLVGVIDQLEVSGTNLFLEAVCYAPDWACFDLAKGLQDGQDLPLELDGPGLTLSSAATHLRDTRFRSFKSTGRHSLVPFPRRPRRLPGRGRPFNPFPPGGRIIPLPPAIDPGNIPSRKASLVIDFDDPVTRVLVTLGSEAEVSGFVEGDQVATVSGIADETVRLASEHGYFDRVVISGRSPLLVGRVCWDTGDLGWQRETRVAWRESLERAIERFSGESPVFDPGRYRLDVAALTTTIAPDGSESTKWNSKNQEFEVGPPPGLGGGDSDGYPDNGPLAGLGPYVRRTLPRAGQEPVYRKDDVKIGFTENYVARMYLAVNRPMSMRVTDARGQISRRAVHNAWGGTRRELRVDEETWMASLHEGARCASIDLERVAQDETLNSAGKWMSAASLQIAELRADNRSLYAMEFVSSLYGSFQHHLAHATRDVRDLSGAGSDPGLSGVLASLQQSRAELAQVARDLQRLINRSSSPDREELDQRRDLEVQIKSRLEVSRKLEESAFDRIATRHDIRKTAGLPANPEFSRLPGMLLLESPEPLHTHRLRIELLASNQPPLRRRSIEFVRRLVGDPDEGLFRYQRLVFDTSRELRCRAGVLRPAIGGAWVMKVSGDRLHGLVITVEVEPGGEARLGGQGEGVGVEQVSPQDHEGEWEMTLLADRLEEGIIAGKGFSLKSLSVMESAIEPRPRSAFRIEEIGCPSATGANDHFVALIALEAVNLEGLSLAWDDAAQPRGRQAYHEFAPERLEEGERVVVQGGRSTPDAVRDSRVRVGGTQGTVPRAGLTVELVDGDGATLDSSGRLADSAYSEAQDLVMVANPDQTRLLLIDNIVDTGPRHFALDVRYARDAGRPWPVQTVGGSRRGERIWWPLGSE